MDATDKAEMKSLSSLELGSSCVIGELEKSVLL